MAAKVVVEKLRLPLLILAILLFAAIFGFNFLPSGKKQTFGVAADYSWVKGQLEYSELEGGFWIIKYGEETNKFGGKFVLGNNPKLSNFKNGDLVKITGHISEEQVSFYQAGTLYTIETIEPLE